MEFVVITLFPQVFESLISTSILGRAKRAGLIKIKLLDLRDFGAGKHQTVDNKPFGGGQGMVIRVDSGVAAIVAAKKQVAAPSKTILLTATGKVFNQKLAAKFAKLSGLVLFCGHYEGVDERVAKFVDEQISVGDFILTGGEIGAMIVIDAVTRLVPSVLPKLQQNFESFSENLLSAPVYTRPQIFKRLKVPRVLLTGNFSEITKWQKHQRILKTKKFRPDLFEKYLQGANRK